MKLNKQIGQRMWGNGGGRSSVGGVGGGSGSGVSSAWVEQNYISKAFFTKLFGIHGQVDSGGNTTAVDVLPNDLDTDITSIEAKYGLWTESFLSCLGMNPSGGGGGGGASALTDLTDVAISSPANGQVLMYDGTTGKWYNGSVQGGGGGTVTAITAGTGLSGGTITSSGTIALSEESQTALSLGSTAYGWGNHADAGYITSSALAGYATQQWVNNQGFLTSSAISDMATRTWVGQQGFLTSSALSGYATQTWVGQNYLGINATAAKATKLETARTLWGQSFDGSANVTGSLSNIGNLTSSSLGSINDFRCIEFKTANDANNGGYIDFHYSGDNSDFTSRIIESASGILNLNNRVYIDRVNGYTGVNKNNPSYPFDVNGNAFVGGALYTTGNLLMRKNGTDEGMMIEAYNSSGNLTVATLGLHAANGDGWAQDANGNSVWVLQVVKDANSSSVAKRYVRVQDALRIGDGLLMWDSSNNAFKVIKIDGTACNLYATGGVSCLGFSN